MKSSGNIPSALHCAGDSLHGFEITSVTPMPSVRAVAYLATHVKSGARLLHLHAEDKENLLAIAFRTPPPDDTGLPHILEHTVLCGSKRYPVKDPFVELLKTSMATFLNAMTYPDKTVYPCASMVDKDFFNIAGVYCDAVFHPNISEKHFKQEGHHFDFTEPGNIDSPLIIKGIVYNEMKGVYSDLDGLIERDMTKGIMPDNAYGRDSGGDPDAIAELTYEQFKQFHENYYHPSNGLIFLYGGIPTEKHLAFLDGEFLSQFDRIDIDTTISDQPRWSQPRRKSETYPIGAEEDLAEKTAIVMTFLTNSSVDPIRTLSMNLLDHYLLANSASPLRKALIDSKLGQQLTDSGYASFQRDTFFTIGLKGSEAGRTDALVELVLSTLKSIADEGLDRDLIEAAFHQLEMSTKEIPDMYPLVLMERVYCSWLYEADPLHHLRMNEHLAEMRKRYETQSGFFETQLRELLVENPHYTVYTYTPDKAYTAGKQKAFQEHMQQVKASLSREQLQQIVTEAAELDEMQTTPNSPQALATLPRLELSDVPAEPIELNTTITDEAGAELLYTDEFANGMNYLNLTFDLRGLDEELFDFVGLYTDVIQKMGAGEYDYVEMAKREAAQTGGVDTFVVACGRVNDPTRPGPRFNVSCKALDAKLTNMLDILADRILRCDLTDTARLKDIVLQARVSRQSILVPNGWDFAFAHAQRHLTRNAALAERFGGFTQFRQLNMLADDFDGNVEKLIEQFGRIRDFIATRAGVTASFVGDTIGLDKIKTFLAGFKVSDHPGEAVSEDAFDSTLNSREGIANPAEVAFVCRAWQVGGLDSPHAPALALLSVNLSYGYLWEQVRVRGGAYGARAQYVPVNGMFRLGSYRDPFVKETLDAYAGLFDYIENDMDLSTGVLEQAIVGTIKTLDHPIRPSQAVGTAMARHLAGETSDIRKDFRRRLLALTENDIRTAGNFLREGYESSPICVLASREKLIEANEKLGAEKLTISDL